MGDSWRLEIRSKGSEGMHYRESTRSQGIEPISLLKGTFLFGGPLQTTHTVSSDNCFRSLPS